MASLTGFRTTLARLLIGAALLLTLGAGPALAAQQSTGSCSSAIVMCRPGTVAHRVHVGPRKHGRRIVAYADARTGARGPLAYADGNLRGHRRHRRDRRLLAYAA